MYIHVYTHTYLQNMYTYISYIEYNMYIHIYVYVDNGDSGC